MRVKIVIMNEDNFGTMRKGLRKDSEYARKCRLRFVKLHDGGRYRVLPCGHLRSRWMLTDE